MAGKVIEIHDPVSKDRIELTDKENKQYQEILNTALELEERHKKVREEIQEDYRKFLKRNEQHYKKYKELEAELKEGKITIKDFNSIDNLAYNTIQSELIQSKDKLAAAESANNLEVEKHTKVLQEFQATVVTRHILEKAKSEYNRIKEDIDRCKLIVTTLKQQIKKPPHYITELSLAHLQRDLKKYQYHTSLLEKRRVRRYRVFRKERPPIEEVSDTEYSDGGYSSAEDLKDKECLPHRYKLTRSTKRVPHPSQPTPQQDIETHPTEVVVNPTNPVEPVDTIPIVEPVGQERIRMDQQRVEEMVREIMRRGEYNPGDVDNGRGQTKVGPMSLDTHAIKRDMNLGEKRRLDIDLYSRENEKVIVNLKTERKDRLVQTLPAVISKGTIFLTAVNNTDIEWKIERYQMMGSLDCRSLGYFHISRHSLQRIMSDNANFLNDRETVEYFNILMEDHKNVMKFAQETVLQRQKMEAERNTQLKSRKGKGKEDFNDSNMSEDNDPYPWLDKDDPRRNMTDRECLEKYIDLSDSDITERERRNLYKVLYKYKKAFSLRDEIGLCQSMEVELELRDETPFFIRPFPIKESDKDIVDKEMRKGCLLGILKKGMSSYSSRIMLIPRKLSGIPRIVTDFRHLNSRLVTLQPSIPLVRHAIQI